MTHAIIVFAHGSKDVLWRQPVEAVAARIQQRAPTTKVRCAYLEWTKPSLQEAMAELVALGCTNITVLPLFLGIGKHVREDLPALFKAAQEANPSVAIDLRPSVGEDARVIDLLASLALGKPSTDH